MPVYNVIAPGFMHGKLYAPNHPRRHTMTTAKPLKPVPSWLEPVKPGKAPREPAKPTDPGVDPAAEIAAVTFQEAPKPTGPGVETLG